MEKLGHAVAQKRHPQPKLWVPSVLQSDPKMFGHLPLVGGGLRHLASHGLGLR